MAQDALDIEAKRRGVSRDTLVAYYMKMHNMTGQNGTMAPAAPAQPVAQPKPQTDNRGPLQRLMDALGGNPSGR